MPDSQRHPGESEQHANKCEHAVFATCHRLAGRFPATLPKSTTCQGEPMPSMTRDKIGNKYSEQNWKQSWNLPWGAPQLSCSAYLARGPHRSRGDMHPAAQVPRGPGGPGG